MKKESSSWGTYLLTGHNWVMFCSCELKRVILWSGPVLGIGDISGHLGHQIGGGQPSYMRPSLHMCPPPPWTSAGTDIMFENRRSNGSGESWKKIHIFVFIYIYIFDGCVCCAPPEPCLFMCVCCMDTPLPPLNMKGRAATNHSQGARWTTAVPDCDKMLK